MERIFLISLQTIDELYFLYLAALTLGGAYLALYKFSRKLIGKKLEDLYSLKCEEIREDLTYVRSVVDKRFRTTFIIIDCLIFIYILISCIWFSFEIYFSIKNGLEVKASEEASILIILLLIWCIVYFLEKGILSKIKFQLLFNARQKS